MEICGGRVGNFPAADLVRMLLQLQVTGRLDPDGGGQNDMRIRFIFLVLFAFASSSLFAQGTQGTQGTCTPQPCPTPTPSSLPSTSPTFFSTKFEVSPYAGYLWFANNNGVGSFMNNQILGVRGGGYVTQALEIGGNWHWNNHFQPKPENTTAAFAGDLGFPQATVRSNLFELEFTYHFGRRSLFGTTALRPYLVAGAGDLRTNMKNGDVFVLNNTFIDVPGVSPATLEAAQATGTLQDILPGINTTNGVAFVGTPTGSTAVVARDVLQDSANYFTFSYGGGLKAQRIWGPMGFFGDVRGRTIPNFFNGHGTNLLEVSAGLNFAWGER
jgi:hypothetical protein